MSFESDLFSYLPNESADLPFFAPPPQAADAPSPDSFDNEVDNEVGELNINWFFNDNFSFQDTVSVVSTPPALTYSTDSSYAFSQYSYDNTPSASDYSNPSEIEACGSVKDGLYTMHGSIYSAVFSDGPTFPPVSPVTTQSDYGTSNLGPNFIRMSLDESSAEQSACVAPTPLHATPNSKAQTGPLVTKPFKCPLCPFCMSKPMGIYIRLTLLASLRAQA
jgi:hypothetical protein